MSQIENKLLMNFEKCRKSLFVQSEKFSGDNYTFNRLARPSVIIFLVLNWEVLTKSLRVFKS